MNNNQKEPKFIPRRDFIYLCLILVIILIAVISYFLGDSSKAGENLNFGATAVSIVLAVVAIIMTIVDSAGQKENVYQMRIAAENLAKSVEDEKTMITQFSIELQKVTNLKDELLEKISETQEWREGVMSQLKKLAEGSEEKNTINIEDVQKLMAKETEKQSGNRRLINYSKRERIRETVLKVLRNNPPLRVSEIYNSSNAFGYFRISEEEVENELIDMAFSGVINSTKDDKYYLLEAV